MKRGRMASAMGGDGADFRISSLISFPGRLAVGCFSFLVHSWSSSRHLWPFLWGLPAAFVLLAAVAVATVPPWLLKIDKKRSDFYTGRFGYYLSTAGDAPQALACAWRLVEQNADELEYKYAVGQALQTGGDLEAAAYIMRSLAPEDRAGFSRAHVWLADYHLIRAGAHPEDLEEVKRMARLHLNHALQQQAEAFTLDTANASMRLAQLFLSESRYDEARPLLEELVGRRWEFIVQLNAMPLLLECLKQLDLTERAELVCDRLVNELAPLARRNPDSVELWNALIACCLRVERFEVAQEFLVEGLALARDQRTKLRLLLMKAELYVVEANTYTDFNSPEDARARLVAACRAVLINSSQKNAYQILHPYINAYLVDSDRERLLREAMLETDTRSVVQLMIGFAEALRNQESEAEQMWRIASQTFPNAANVLAGLVITALEQPQVNFEQLTGVLALASRVFVDHYAIDMARAEIKLAEGEPDRALEILEPFRERYASSIQFQSICVKAYEALGQLDKAAEARELIKQLVEQL